MKKLEQSYIETNIVSTYYNNIRERWWYVNGSEEANVDRLVYDIITS